MLCTQMLQGEADVRDHFYYDELIDLDGTRKACLFEIYLPGDGL